MFYLRAEKPVYRIGIVALAIAAALLLIAVNAKTNELIPLFTIGVFIGFTISQVGLVRHWRQERPAHWRLRAALNGTGAVMTAIAVVVFLVDEVPRGRVGGGDRDPCADDAVQRDRALLRRGRRAS